HSTGRPYSEGLGSVGASVSRGLRGGQLGDCRMARRHRKPSPTQRAPGSPESIPRNSSRDALCSTSVGFNDAVIADFRAHGGQITKGPFTGRSLLLLTTKGARTGQTRTNPLAYTRDGDHFVVIASKGGSPENPDW